MKSRFSQMVRVAMVLPTWRRFRLRLLFGAGLVLANVGLFLGLVLPSQLEVRALRAETDALRAKTVASRLASERATRDTRLRESAERLRDRLPSRREMPEVVRTLQSLAHESEVDLLGLVTLEGGGDAGQDASQGAGLKRGARKEGPRLPGLETVSYQIPVEGTYPALRGFIRRIESADWFYAVRDLSLQKIRGEEQVRMQITVTTLVRHGEKADRVSR
jgi:Tfp pilus assembly protein PilO